MESHDHPHPERDTIYRSLLIAVMLPAHAHTHTRII